MTAYACLHNLMFSDRGLTVLLILTYGLTSKIKRHRNSRHHSRSEYATPA